MKSTHRKPRPPQPGLETDIQANPAARAWLHTALAGLTSYTEIARELAARFGIKGAASKLSKYYHRHCHEFGRGEADEQTETFPSGGLEISITASGAERITVQVRPLAVKNGGTGK